MTSINSNKRVIPKLAPGLHHLEAYVGYDMMLYILRYLYNLVLRSKRLGHSKERLQHQIQKFERR